MRLFELAYACRVYGHMTDYDGALVQFRKAAQPQLDPLRPEHQAALFRWLNEWGCRQFAKQHHATVAAVSLVQWADRWLGSLPGSDTRLEDLSPAELERAAEAYGALHTQIASHRGARATPVRFGATGAAKTLFALRPNVFAPWDDPIRVRLGLDGGAASFGTYLATVADDLRALAAEAGVSVAELPALVGRPRSTPPKLIDEYNWVVITRNSRPPSRAELAKWLQWADLPPRG
jgi:hypothetical protein